MAQEFSDGRQPTVMEDFEAQIAAIQIKADGLIREVDAQQVESQASAKVLQGLKNVMLGERSVLRNLCRQQADIMNPRFKSGEVTLDDMVRQAYVIADGMRHTERDRSQLATERVATERVLPLLQEPGTRYAVFGYDWLTFEVSKAPAYLKTGESVYIEIPAKPTKYHDAVQVNPLQIEVEPGAILERYKEFQKSKIEGAAKQREDFGGRRYRNEQTPIECAKIGRAMASQKLVKMDEEAQILIRASQGPLRQYLDDMIPELVRPGNFSTGSSDAREFLYAIDEARHLNVDKIREVVEALVHAVGTADRQGHTESMIDLIALITEHAEYGSKKGSDLDNIKRHARAVQEAVAMVEGVAKGDWGLDQPV